MKRRDFINTGILTTLAGGLISPKLLAGNSTIDGDRRHEQAKNIIFLVSDGMSTGTLAMADLLLQRKEGRSSTWMSLYQHNRVRRALMDTASADSLVTDSAAASSAWGGGVSVNNGALNTSPNGVAYTSILQKFKSAGKSVGCVTTVPITHATPAGFCISADSRRNQENIALMYLPLRFDVMMGGGADYFSNAKRKDGKDLLRDFTAAGYHSVLTKDEMETAQAGKPVIGLFANDGLPYALDQRSDDNLTNTVPSLASMTRKAIGLMSGNPNGFVLQVEGGKVDWAAHANDIGAMLYDQIAFDDAVAIAVEFAEKHNDTLIIIKTDHGNSNPGLIKSSNVGKKFDMLQQQKYSNEWVLNGIDKNHTTAQVIERFNFAQGIVLKEEEAKNILSDYASLSDDGIYNARKLPYRKVALIQQSYTSVGWSGMDHSADFVELAMLGPGSDLLSPFIKNTDLHRMMLDATGMA